MSRVLLPFFNTENRIYGRGTFTAFTVSSGVKTATKATLYAAPTGSATLANPQTLSSNGRLQQPVYIEDDVILTIAAVHAASHDTGIVPAFQHISGSELTIASGVVTRTNEAPHSYHKIDTESDASTDDVDTISAGTFAGQRITFQAADDARTVVFKQGTGNYVGLADVTLDNVNDAVTFIWNGTNWNLIEFAGGGT